MFGSYVETAYLCTRNRERDAALKQCVTDLVRQT